MSNSAQACGYGTILDEGNLIVSPGSKFLVPIPSIESLAVRASLDPLQQHLTTMDLTELS